MTKSIEATNSAMPAFLQKNQGVARGAEDVGSDDITLPRIEVVQSLSKCRDSSEPDYIDGITEGDLYNTLTRDKYPDVVKVIPVCFKKEYLVWVKASEGGGFRGSFDTAEEARGAMSTMEDAEKCEMNDTSQHFVLVVREDGQLEQAVISMAKSKRKVSRAWNALMRLRGGDTFSTVYNLEGVSAKNADGQKFFNFKVGVSDYVTEDQYAFAESMYGAIMAGAFKVDREDESAASAAATDIDLDCSEM